MPLADAVKDLAARAELAKAEYESLTSSSDCWARIYDMGRYYYSTGFNSVLVLRLLDESPFCLTLLGRTFEANNAQSYLQSRIMYYLMSFHTSSRSIYVRFFAACFMGALGSGH